MKTIYTEGAMNTSAIEPFRKEVDAITFDTALAATRKAYDADNSISIRMTFVGEVLSLLTPLQVASLKHG